MAPAATAGFSRKEHLDIVPPLLIIICSEKEKTPQNTTYSTSMTLNIPYGVKMIAQSSLCCNGREFVSKMGSFKHEMSERLFRIRRSSTAVGAILRAVTGREVI